MAESNPLDLEELRRDLESLNGLQAHFNAGLFEDPAAWRLGLNDYLGRIYHSKTRKTQALLQFLSPTSRKLLDDRFSTDSQPD